MRQPCVERDSRLSLLACALAAERFPELGLVDPAAARLARRLDVDARGVPDRDLREAAVRAAAFDDVVRDFARRRPGGVVLSLHPGFSTRSSRVDDDAVRFVDLDPPPVAAAKSRLMPTSARHAVAACGDLACPGWMRLLAGAPDVPFLLLSEGALVRSGPRVADAFVTSASRWAPAGVEVVLDLGAMAPRDDDARRASSLRLAAPDGAARYPRLRRFASATPGARDLAPTDVVVHLRFV